MDVKRSEDKRIHGIDRERIMELKRKKKTHTHTGTDSARIMYMDKNKNIIKRRMEWDGRQQMENRTVLLALHDFYIYRYKIKIISRRPGMERKNILFFLKKNTNTHNMEETLNEQE